MNISTRLNTYIFYQSIMGFLIALISVCLSIIMVDLVEQMRAVSGVPNTNIGTALSFTFMRLPGLVEQTIPIVILIGSIITYTGLSRKSEIISMRAAGLSAWQFITPLGILAFLIGINIILVIGPLASSLNEKYETTKAQLNSSFVQKTDSNTAIVWKNYTYDKGQLVIQGKAIDDNHLTNVTIYEFDMKGTTLNRRIDSNQIVIKNNVLVVYNAIENQTGQEQINRELITYEVNKNTLNSQTKEPKLLTAWELPEAAIKAQISGGNPEKYWLRFYKLLGLPFTMVAMAVFAALMSIGLDRSGGKAKSIFIAICVGIFMYFIGDLTGIMATSGIIPAIIAGLCPPIILITFTLYLFSIKED